MTDEVISIESTRDPGDAGRACLVRWGAVERYASVDDTRRTAEDLMTCAAYADLIGELLRIGLDAKSLAGLMRSIVSKRQQRYFGTPQTLFLLPGGSSQRKVGVVLLGRRDLFHQGKTDGVLTADESRTMPRAWLEAAEASEADSLLHQVLSRADWLSGEELDAVFGLVRDIRSETEGSPVRPK